jgi:cell division protein ZapA (FtsZ GTPase activity inhibitor)
MAGEINRLVENEEEVSMYQISEQKKFTLKTPKAPAPMPEPAAELPPPAPAPEEGSMDAPLDDASLDMPAGDEMDMDMELDTPEGDMDIDMSSEEEPMGGEEEEITFKTIQKLTGKLGQKIRMMNDSVGMTSEDVKYVINSLLSALDLSKLDEEDQEDIMSKFEEDQESDYDSDMDMGSMGDDEDMDVDMDVDMDME